MVSDSSGITPYYTICLNIQAKPCLIVGGGDVARRKAASLSDCGGRVRVISPKVDPILEYMASQKEVEWLPREFQESDISGDLFIVIAATDRRAINHRIGELCRTQRILCNVVDEPDDGSYIVPSVVERGPLIIAISTSGISPTLAASIRQELEMAYGEEYGLFCELMAEIRPLVQKQIALPQARQKIFDRMVSSRAISLLRNGLTEKAREELLNILEQAKSDPNLPSGGSLPILPT